MSELKMYKEFYTRVKYLTMNHHVLDDTAVVFPTDLAKALEKIDPHWYNTGVLEVKGKDTEDAYIQLNEKMLAELGWDENTILEWDEIDQGFILRKKDNT